MLQRNTRFLEQKQKRIEELKRNKESMDETNKCSFKPIINKNVPKERNLDDLMTWKAKVDKKLNRVLKKDSSSDEKKGKTNSMVSPVYINNRFMQLDHTVQESKAPKTQESVSSRLYNYKCLYDSKRLINQKLLCDKNLKSQLSILETVKKDDQHTFAPSKDNKRNCCQKVQKFNTPNLDKEIKVYTLQDLNRIRVKHAYADKIRTPSKSETRTKQWDKFGENVAKHMAMAMNMTFNNHRELRSNNWSFYSQNAKVNRAPKSNNNVKQLEGIDVYIRKIEKLMKVDEGF